MHLHINHVFCTDSNWGGSFLTRYVVSLNSLLKVDQEDCKNLLLDRERLDEDRWAFTQEESKKDKMTEQQLEILKKFCKKRFKDFKPEILKWLEENIDPVKDKKQPQGWCVGSEAYQMRSEYRATIWFVRKKDALKFIKHFSIHKNPTTYFDYFKEIRKELDMKKKVLVTVDDYSKEIEKYSHE